MAKMRVHELAKEYDLSNKEVITLLQKAGMDVKSHSNSVDEDEAKAALKGTAAPAKESKPKARKRPGMMIVRKKKKKDTDEQESVETSADTEADEVQDAPEAAPEPVAAAAVAEEAPQAAQEQVSVPDESPAEPVAVADTKEQDTPPEPTASAETPSSAEPTAAAEASAEPAPAEAAPEKPKGGAKVLRMIDREKLLERVPSSRLGGDEGPGERQGGGGSRSYGQVTELKVVNDPFGRGRQMVDVGRDRRGKGGKGKRGAAGGAAAPGGRRDSRGGWMRDNRGGSFPSRLRKKKGTKRSGGSAMATQPKASKRVVKMKETITVSDLAHQLSVKAGEVLRHLIQMGEMTNINGSVDFETAQLVAAEFDYTVESTAFDESVMIDTPIDEEDVDTSHWINRPPVVTIMGHVDHGKTSLLDAIRRAKVASGEAGGITQHIGAYSVEVPGRGRITFLDTPGHAAFTEMRARGAQCTDIVILVVAADDGVMPQTEEAVRHAQAAGVPIIVAVNKMDKPDANPDRVTQELSKFQLLPEDWGGDTLYVPTSATKGTGLDELLEAITLQAEVLELKADPESRASGVVVEAKLDKGRGAVATILVQHGKLKRGDSVVVGEHAGKVRAMTDHLGKSVKEAGPSDAVEIIGLEGVPQAGDSFNLVDSADQAREVAAHRVSQRKAAEASGPSGRMSVEEIMRKMKGEELNELKIVLKADVQGSVEAVKASVEKLSTDEVSAKVLYGGVGAVTESDIMLAAASDGKVFAFNVRPDANARQVAQREGVEIRTYSVIYELLDDVRKAMEGLLAPETSENIIGRAEVREVFKISKVGVIGGSRVTDGKAMRSARVRVLRDSVPIYEGKVSSLKHFKDDVREVDSGHECGIGVEGYQDLKQNDIIEFFEVQEVMRTLDSGNSARA